MATLINHATSSRGPGRIVFIVLAAVAALVPGCANHGDTARKPPARPWSAAPDVAELGRLWRSAKPDCSLLDPSVLRYEKTLTQAWNCAVAGWESVTFASGPADRRLLAHGDEWKWCELRRLAAEYVIVDRMEGKIVSEVTAMLKSGPLSGMCAAASFWYDRPGCDLTLMSACDRL